MPAFDRFQALSFDCYGTLIDWEQGILEALRPWVARSGIAATEDELLTAFSEIESREEAADPGRYPDVLGRVLRQLGQRFAVAVADEDAAAFGASVPAWPAFPDSPEALRRLKRRFKLVILSNVDRGSFAASNERLGVTFDAIVTAEDVGSYKPDPRNFAALLDTVGALGVPAAGLLHVAQSLFHDHVPAKGMGLSTVWIDRRSGQPGTGATPAPGAEVRPDWTFPTLADFADAVEADS